MKNETPTYEATKVTIAGVTFDVRIFATLNNERATNRAHVYEVTHNNESSVELHELVASLKADGQTLNRGKNFLGLLLANAGLDAKVSKNTRRGYFGYGSYAKLTYGDAPQFDVTIEVASVGTFDRVAQARHDELVKHNELQARWTARAEEAKAKFEALIATGLRLIEAEIETDEGYVYNVRCRNNWHNDGSPLWNVTLKNASSYRWENGEDIQLNATEYPSSADIAAAAAKADAFEVAVMC